MFTNIYPLYSDMQAASNWAGDLEHVDISSYVHDHYDTHLIGELEKQSTNLGSSSISEDSFSPAFSLNPSSTSSVSSASSYMTNLSSSANDVKIFDPSETACYADKPILVTQAANTSYLNNTAASDNKTNTAVNSPTSSCVSPTLTSSNATNNTMNYLLESQNTMNHLQFHQPVDEVKVKLENESQDVLAEELFDHTPSAPRGNADEPAKQGSTKKPKEAKSGRVKKPMTLVQRKAHNKIERKYRININSKIANLQKLVPWMSEDGVAFEIDHKPSRLYPANQDDKLVHGDSAAGLPSPNKRLNKSMILDMVTEYILLLKDECRKKDNEIFYLKEQLKVENMNNEIINHNVNNNH